LVWRAAEEWMRFVLFMGRKGKRNFIGRDSPANAESVVGTP